MSDDPERLYAELVDGCEFGPFSRLRRWLEGSAEFRAFCRRNADKIHRKLREATTIDAALAAIAELHVAGLMLTLQPSEVGYERGGPAGPDLHIRHSEHGEFLVEVRRIRGRAATEDISNWERALRDCVRTVPGSVWVSHELTGLRFGITDGEDRRAELAEFVATLEACANELHAWLRERLGELECTLVPGGDHVLEDPPGLKGVIRFRFHRARVPEQPAHCCPGAAVGPVPWDGREALKFSGVVWEKLRQLRQGSVNVIAVLNDSSTHDVHELFDVMPAVRAGVSDATPETAGRRGIESVQELKSQWGALSAVVALHASGVMFPEPPQGINAVWINPDAQGPLSDELAEQFRRLRQPG